MRFIWITLNKLKKHKIFRNPLLISNHSFFTLPNNPPRRLKRNWPKFLNTDIAKLKPKNLETGIQNRNQNRKFLIPVLLSWNRNRKITKPKPKFSNTGIEKLKPKSKKLKTGVQNRNRNRNYFYRFQALFITIYYINPSNNYMTTDIDV